VGRIVEWLSPGRLGSGFRWLIASSFAANTSDGIALAAGPLLVASQTRDPFLVAAAVLLQRLPWLLFGLHAGVVADRLNRRVVVVGADLARIVILGVLATTIVTGTVNVTVVLVSLFLLGTAETLVDTATDALLPMLVDDADIGIANARVTAGHITLNQLVAPPVGAFLFTVGMATPFLAQIGLLALAAGLVTRMGPIPTTEPTAAGETEGVLSEIVDGLRWTIRHPPVRTLALTIVSFNVTFGAAFAVMVLYADERLGLGEVGFGLLTSASAIGGVAGAAAYGSLEARFDAATLMRAGLIVETLTHLLFAVTTSPVVAMAVMFGFGFHIAIWGTTQRTTRQRAVPLELQGRIGGVYRTGMQAGLIVGAALGGIIARHWGITAPFWFAFVGSAFLVVALWRELGLIASGPSKSATSERGAGPDLTPG
jgi:MFS family permease